MNFRRETKSSSCQNVSVYSGSVYALLDSGIILNVMLSKLTHNSNLELYATERSITVASGAIASCKGVVTNALVGFGSIFVRAKLVVLSKVHMA